MDIETRELLAKWVGSASTTIESHTRLFQEMFAVIESQKQSISELKIEVEKMKQTLNDIDSYLSQHGKEEM